MDKEYIVLEEISVIDYSIVGCPIAHLGMVAHRGSAEMNLIKLVPDDAAAIVSRKHNQVKFQYNLDHGVVKMITWTLLLIND